MNKYTATAALAVAFALWQMPTSPALAFLGFVGAGLAAVGYAVNRGGAQE